MKDTAQASFFPLAGNHMKHGAMFPNVLFEVSAADLFFLIRGYDCSSCLLVFE
jgi:hypothetical protein